MCGPFVRACNYALDELSKIQNGEEAKGLPKFLPENQIVFINNHYRSVDSESVEWNSLTISEPDIVVLQWDDFTARLNHKIPYSDSHSELCVSSPNLDLSWGDVRSTVEMKISGLPKPAQGKKDVDSDVDFVALDELPPYVAPYVDPRPTVVFPVLPNFQCECTSFGELLSLIFLDRYQDLRGFERKRTPHHCRKFWCQSGDR